MRFQRKTNAVMHNDADMAVLVRQLQRELTEANLRIKELESEGDRAIAFARQGSKTCADAVWYRVRNKS